MVWAPGTTFPSLPGSSPWGQRTEFQPVDGAEMMSTIPRFMQDPFVCSSPSAPSIDVTGSRWHSDSWNKTQSLSGCLEESCRESQPTHIKVGGQERSVYYVKPLRFQGYLLYSPAHLTTPGHRMGRGRGEAGPRRQPEGGPLTLAAETG